MPITDNEEKEPMFFVWELQTTGRFAPAIYRGQPVTGMGTNSKRFHFIQKLTDDECANLGLLALCDKYPCPPRKN